MKKTITKTLWKRLDALSVNVVSDVPYMTFIDQEGGKFSVIEYYSSPWGDRYRRFTLNSPDEYIPKGGIVFTGEWLLED